MTVIWEYYISHMKIYSKYFSEVNQSKQRINFNSVCFFDPCVIAWFIEVITSLQTCYIAFILVFVQSTILSMISLSKYKWKVSSMFSILFALEFGARQLILLEKIFHFCCLPVALGCSEFLLNFIFVFVFLWTEITTQFFQNAIFLHLYNFFAIVFNEWTVNVVNVSIASELVFLARIFVADLHYFQILHIALISLSITHLG